MRDDRERLLDLREAIERIEKYTAAGRSALERDELIQTWVIYHLQIIGMRNILAHRYFGIDVDIVWSAVEHDLPELKSKVDLILQEMKGMD